MTKQSDISSKPGSSGWHIALEHAAVEGGYLGDPKVVETLVRQFFGGVVTRYGHVVDGEMQPADASATDRSSCERMGRIFAGQDEGYSVIGGWNGSGLADAFREDMDDRLSGDAELDDLTAITEAFAVLVHLVYDIIRAMPHTAGDAVDPATKTKLEALVTYAVKKLLGVSK